MARRTREAGTNMVGFHGSRSHLASRWRVIMDLDFKTMTAGALTENDGSLTALDGYEYHCRVANAASASCTMTNSTGLVVDFAASSNQQGRVAWRIQNYDRQVDGCNPRFRVTASFSGLVFSHNADYIGVGIMAGFANNANPYAPGVYIRYDCTDSTADPVTKKYDSIVIADWGGTSSADQDASNINSNNSASGVLSVEDAGSGHWHTRADDDTVAIKSGQQTHTFRNTMLCPYETDRNLTAARYFGRDGSMETGPYAVLFYRNGSNGSQAVTFERLVVEAYY